MKVARIITWAMCVVLLLALQSSADVQMYKLSMQAGHSKLLDLDQRVKRISVADEKIADVLMISPRQVYVNGKSAGNTNITIWGVGGRVIATYSVNVRRDLTRLKATYSKIFPDEQIKVYELEGAVVIAGTVSSDANRTRAEEIAKIYEKERVTSLLEVENQKQVLLKLRFAEVNRQAAKRFNINLGYWDPSNPGSIFFTFLDGLTGPPSIDYSKGEIDLDLSTKLGGWAGWGNGNSQYMAFLDILKSNGLAKILAEPNLVCVSGQKANFLAGGEFPIPVPGKDYTAIVFKKYGVQLTFVPKVLPNGKINLQVEPEVSELDYTPGVVTDGFVVPGLTTRKVSTQLELKDGQGFVIAGLLKQDVSRSVSKWPLLGDLPIIGALFRSTAYQNRETELLIVVTPIIVRPGMQKPTQLIKQKDFEEPDDVDFYVWGKTGMEDDVPAYKRKSEDRLMEMEGKFGHEVVY